MKPFMKDPKPTPRKTDRLALDLETFLIVPGAQAPPIASMGFKLASDRRKHIVTAADPAFDRLVLEMLSDRGLLMHGHHFRFDIACLLARNPEWAELIFQKFNDDGFTCTLIRDSLIRIARANPMHDFLKYDLASAYKLYCKDGKLDVNKEDPNRLRWGLYAGMTVEEMRAKGHGDALAYLDIDVDAADELYLGQEGFVFTHQGVDYDMLADQFRQTRASFVLYLMQCWGVVTDHEQVARLHAQTLAALDEAREVCAQHGLVVNGKRNIAAASEYQERAYAKLGLPAPRNEVTAKAKVKAYDGAFDAAKAKGLTEEAAKALATETVDGLRGNVVLDEEACKGAQDPIMLAYSKTSQASLLLGKVTRLKRPIIQASYNTLVNTGRTSCRQGKDPKKGVAPSAFGSQMQNPPREVLAKCPACAGEGKINGAKCESCKGEGEVPVPGVRECFIARPGYCIVSIDFDAFEMRTWAQVCLWMVGYSKLAEILNDPARCPHVEMGAMIRGLELAICYQWKKEGDKRIKPIRSLAKGPNFGLPGGMGAERLVAYCWDTYGVSITLEEAKAIIKVWKTIYPEAQPYLDLIGKMVNERGARTRIIQHLSGRVRGGVGFCDASNTFFQGLAADASKASLWAVACEMYAVKSSPLYGARMLAFVHDELVAEVPMEGLHERCLRLQQLWCGAAQEIVPDVLISASPAASFRWSKGAGDPIFDKAGRLIPYEAGPKYQAMVDAGAALPAPAGQMERWTAIAA